jgi:hypothetical protein
VLVFCKVESFVLVFICILSRQELHCSFSSYFWHSWPPIGQIWTDMVHQIFFFKRVYTISVEGFIEKNKY